jgi:hypothetical protein
VRVIAGVLVFALGAGRGVGLGVAVPVSAGGRDVTTGVRITAVGRVRMGGVALTDGVGVGVGATAPRTRRGGWRLLFALAFEFEFARAFEFALAFACGDAVGAGRTILTEGRFAFVCAGLAVFISAVEVQSAAVRMMPSVSAACM